MQRDFSRGGHSGKEHKILCMKVCFQSIRAYFGMSVEWERLGNARVPHRNGNWNLLQRGRQGVTQVCAWQCLTAPFQSGVGSVCSPCCCHRGATCRWFAGNVPEEALIPADPAASLDCPSLEDVLRCQEAPEPD